MAATHAPYPLAGRRVFVAGHKGMVGSAIVRRLRKEDCVVVTVDRSITDLRDQSAVAALFKEQRPDTVFLAAAKVGGILANDTYPAEFLRDNLVIQSNVIHSAYETGVSKLLFLGSSCIYPKHAPQPMPEQALLTGPLEPTNEWYAIAKIAGLKMCAAYRRQYGCDFISAMPTNLYGPGDNFDLQTSHVIPALMRKAHEAKQAGRTDLRIWGTGRPRREFLHVDDAADAMVHLMMHYSDDAHINVGTGTDVSIFNVARLIARVVGLSGDIVTDPTKPDGTPRKLLDVTRLSTAGWRPRYSLEEGLAHTYAWFKQHAAAGDARLAVR